MDVIATTTTQSSTGHFLQQIYTSLTQELSLQALNRTMHSTYVNPQDIDQMVEKEMKLIRENCSRKQEQYVEQMLLENPITIERRTSVNRHQFAETSATEDIGKENHQLQQQRADACRRSRHNNKIKKAKSKYRHKYMSQKLLQSTQMFDCIQDLIAQAESQLVAQGLSRDKLQQMRCSYGVDKARDNVRSLDHIMKTGY